MSCDKLPKQQKQQGFKGVEQFLRRVAFNLGNSPSQTEVKIISCIPIDVTDLQQKIVSLEKELELAKKKGPNPTTCFNNNKVQVSRPKSSSNAKNQPTATSQKPHCTSKKVWGSKDTPNVTAQAPCVQLCEGGCVKWSSSEASCESAGPPPRPKSPTPPTPPTPHTPPPHPPLPGCKSKENSECLCWPTDISIDGDSTNCFKRGFFKKSSSKKKKSQKKKVNCKTQFVYYAQTENSPFSIYENQKIPIKDNNLPNNGGISRAYIKEMIHKQYTAVPIAKELSVTSQFSSPVCRDAESRDAAGRERRPAACDSDLCSCCRGAFHNIDCDTTNRNHAYINNDQLPNCSYNTYVNTTDFYDSSLYDMVPVKEKPVKPPLYHETPKRKMFKNDMNVSRFPERNRQKYRYHPFIVNYSKVYKKEALVNKKENYRRYSPKREEVTRKAEQNYDEDSVRSCSIDCGPVYMKVHPSAKAPPVVSIMPVAVKNAECLTSSLNDTECQTNTTQSDYVQIGSDFYEDKKTEETLNQIKVILQSVLTEVKTNTQVKQKPEDKPTKDTLAQQGLSPGAVPGCSSMLNSYNHSPYNMNPYNISSCSQQINPGACCYSNVSYASGKCLQNFPVFIQTPGRNMCSSCFRNSSHVTKGASPRLAGTPAATNTDAANNDRSNETAKLIKEIYKSITVNMEAPKDNSASEYGGAKKSTRSTVNQSLDRFLDKGMKIVMKSNAASMKNEVVQKWPTTVPTFNSKLTSNSVSVKTQRTQASDSTDTVRCLRNNRIESFLKNIEAQKARKNKIAEEYELPTRTASEDELYSDYESELYSAATSKLPQKKPDKKGLFSKMFKRSAKLFSAKKKKERTKKKEEQVQVQEEGEQYQESDAESDDYQTIYSQREMQFGPRRAASPGRGRGRARAAGPRRARGTRRDGGWPDQQTHRYSSETSRSRDTDPRRWNPMYNQHYEARSALVQQSLRMGVGTGTGAGVSVGVGMGVGTATHREVTVPRAPGPSVNVAAKGLSWLKQHKMGARCGERWKKFILEA